MDFKKLLTFLKQLEKNNHKEWFDANRTTYEQLRKDWLEFVALVLQEVSKFEPAAKDLDPKKCIFRINRDIRFSKNKAPYKTNFGLQINPLKSSGDFNGYYLHIEPGNCFISGGSYMPQPPRLAAIRQEIDYNFDAFKKIVETSTFNKHFGKLSGDTLTRPPKGYDAENPAIEYLKHKDFIATRQLSEKEVIDKDFIKTVVHTFKAMQPLVQFLNASID
jgi:uncharacterized protein (TIGR02453 family)